MKTVAEIVIKNVQRKQNKTKHNWN